MLVDALMVVIEPNNRAGRELALKLNVKSVRAWSFYAAGGKGAAANGEIAEGIVGESAGRGSHGGTNGIGDLVSSEAS